VQVGFVNRQGIDVRAAQCGGGLHGVVERPQQRHGPANPAQKRGPLQAGAQRGANQRKPHDESKKCIICTMSAGKSQRVAVISAGIAALSRRLSEGAAATWSSTIDSLQKGPLAWLLRSDTLPGRQPAPGQAHWVVHARAGWSRPHLEQPAAWVRQQIQVALADSLGAPVAWLQ
jgi:hypothetical protein